jgi:DNA polymerase-3 subunit delta'
VELANSGRAEELRQIAGASVPAETVRRIEAIMKCRERLAASVAPLLAVEELTLSLVGSAVS